MDGLSVEFRLRPPGVVAVAVVVALGPGADDSSAIITMLLAESLDEPVSSPVWLVTTVWLSRADVV